MRRTTAIETLSRPSPSGALPAAMRKAAGRINAIAASVSIVAWERAPDGLKCCSEWRSPPASMAAPRTSKMFPTMEPAIDAFTTSCNPARNAASAMMSSAALPNVALRSPPTPSPRCSARSSVARPIHPASGKIAREELTKTRRCRSGAMNSTPMAIGTNSRSQVITRNRPRVAEGSARPPSPPIRQRGSRDKR